jgi:hypothetical protein
MNNGACSTNGTTGSRTMLPTSLGMRSGCLDQAATKNLDRSEVMADAGGTSKMSVEDPNTSCAMEINQVCAGRFSIEMRALNLSGEKRAPVWRV